MEHWECGNLKRNGDNVVLIATVESACVIYINSIGCYLRK